jgi:hypothetical protein
MTLDDGVKSFIEIEIENKNIKTNLDARFNELIKFEKKFREEVMHYRKLRLEYEKVKDEEINAKIILNLND